ncbi:MAG: energy transducer TonB [Salibacteraceae bacterium]|jgi:periplasmic protein TonB|nr:energy transducer TonB [Salibacteraceae bacterium]MDP4687739.1 energy transducer TonB [Salibacteraceae bacterium]MDP4762347.1 energy transducer TonB [Salibacteraceae bacterium]MDP4845103.1 energy transducer TonB [Salibacteraceae bacterium]MDP4933715.1 energy transducer TonB [Salibacteraceae bacterium]
MEIKKSPEANLEKKKSFYFLVGLMLSLGVVLVAFEWSKPEEEVGTLGEFSQELEEEEMIPITQQTPPPPPPPPPQTTIIEIVEDDQEIEDELEIEDTEDNEDDVIEFVDIPEEVVEAPQIFTIVEENPEFPGGEKALFEFLGKNTKFPAIAKDAGIQGIVYVQFVVMEDGSINPDMVEILRGVHPALDQEAIRVVKSMPKWSPGKQRGKAVRVYYKLPFRFTLK